MNPLMAYLSLYATALFTTQLISVCVGAPVPGTNGPWVKPCGGGSGESLIPRSTSSPSVTEGLRSLRLISNDTTDKIDTLIPALNISSDNRQNLDSCPPLDGFPVTDVSFTHGKQIDIVRKEVERFSKIAVFLEGARLDTRSYTDKIRSIEQNNIDILCKLHTILPDSSFTVDVSRDIMPTMYRNLYDTTQIDQRNHIIMRDVKKAIVAMKDSLEAAFRVDTSL